MITKSHSRIDSIGMHKKIWLEDESGSGILGDGKWKMLRLIGNFSGFSLLEKHRGGSVVGITQPATEGKRLMAAFDHFHQTVDGTIQKGFQRFIVELKK